MKPFGIFPHYIVRYYRSFWTPPLIKVVLIQAFSLSTMYINITTFNCEDIDSILVFDIAVVLLINQLLHTTTNIIKSEFEYHVLPPICNTQQIYIIPLSKRAFLFVEKWDIRCPFICELSWQKSICN